jgi:hypothetical protein
MDSVIIVAHHDCDLGQLRRSIPPEYRVDDAANGRIVIERADRRAYLGVNARIADELEPEEASRIMHMIPDPNFYVLDFSDISLCKELLIAIADRPDVLIDNDHGVLLAGSEFVRVLRSQQDWDWRQDTA